MGARLEDRLAQGGGRVEERLRAQSWDAWLPIQRRALRLFFARAPAFVCSQIDHSVMAITAAEVVCRHDAQYAGISGQAREMAMYILAVAVVAVVLATPFLVPLMWGRREKA